MSSSCQALSFCSLCWGSGESGRATRIAPIALGLLPHWEHPKMLSHSDLAHFNPSFLAESHKKMPNIPLDRALPFSPSPIFIVSEPFLTARAPTLPSKQLCLEACLFLFTSEGGSRLTPVACILLLNTPAWPTQAEVSITPSVSETLWVESLWVTPEMTDVEWCLWWGLRGARALQAACRVPAHLNAASGVDRFSCCCLLHESGAWKGWLSRHGKSGCINKSVHSQLRAVMVTVDVL